MALNTDEFWMAQYTPYRLAHTFIQDIDGCAVYMEVENDEKKGPQIHNTV